MNDLFRRDLIQKERIYNFIKSRGRVLSHELNTFAVSANINQPGSRARELKAEGKIWHIKDSVMLCAYGNTREEAWSVHEADREISYEETPVPAL